MTGGLPGGGTGLDQNFNPNDIYDAPPDQGLPGDGDVNVDFDQFPFPDDLGCSDCVREFAPRFLPDHDRVFRGSVARELLETTPALRRTFHYAVEKPDGTRAASRAPLTIRKPTP